MALTAVRRRAARRYMAGPELGDALRREEELRDRGLKTVVGYWNAAGEDPGAVEATYDAALDALAGRQGVQLACKLPAVSLDPRRIDEISERAHQAGVPLHFDSLGHKDASPLLEAARSAGAGATLPGRWARSTADAESLAPTDLPVRVIKGEWQDPTAPDRDPRDGFLSVIERLAGRSAPVEVATHDGPLAAEALRRLRDAGTPCELQLLLGLPTTDALAAAREAEVNTRVYVSFGAPHLPYALRALPRHPSLLIRLCADLLLISTFAAF
jgi:proline dehydrogenase